MKTLPVKWLNSVKWLFTCAFFPYQCKSVQHVNLLAISLCDGGGPRNQLNRPPPPPPLPLAVAATSAIDFAGSADSAGLAVGGEASRRPLGGLGAGSGG